LELQFGFQLLLLDIVFSFTQIAIGLAGDVEPASRKPIQFLIRICQNFEKEQAASHPLSKLLRAKLLP
jgi:hypothetical protein